MLTIIPVVITTAIITPQTWLQTEQWWLKITSEFHCQSVNLQALKGYRLLELCEIELIKTTEFCMNHA